MGRHNSIHRLLRQIAQCQDFGTRQSGLAQLSLAELQHLFGRRHAAVDSRHPVKLRARERPGAVGACPAGASRFRALIARRAVAAGAAQSLDAFENGSRRFAGYRLIDDRFEQRFVRRLRVVDLRLERCQFFDQLRQTGIARRQMSHGRRQFKWKFASQRVHVGVRYGGPGDFLGELRRLCRVPGALVFMATLYFTRGFEPAQRIAIR